LPSVKFIAKQADQSRALLLGECVATAVCRRAVATPRPAFAKATARQAERGGCYGLCQGEGVCLFGQFVLTDLFPSSLRGGERRSFEGVALKLG